MPRLWIGKSTIMVKWLFTELMTIPIWHSPSIVAKNDSADHDEIPKRPIADHFLY